MSFRDIVVIGASSGGLQALRELVGGLPADLPAALFVVVHTSSTNTETLALILDRVGTLTAEVARSGEPVRPGRFVVAQGDHHLPLEPGRVRMVRGPKQNGFRPAMDPLFRTELEAANEELQSANEEVLSSNEELQSTNEELDTAKEELQSTNEELNTVNEELHASNEELSHVNSDVVNLLGSVQIAIVIVSSDLRIRRFTPMAEKVLNLIPGDVGAGRSGPSSRTSSAPTSGGCVRRWSTA